MRIITNYPAVFLFAAGLFFTGVGVTAAMTMDLLPQDQTRLETANAPVALHPATILDLA